MHWLTYIVPRIVLKTSSSYNPEILVVEEAMQYKLLVNGSRESGPYIAGLWRHATSKLGVASALPVQNILVLGVAGGTVIHQLSQMFPKANITGVDIDDEMIRLGKKYFELDMVPHLSLITADARQFVTRKNKKYDLIVLDLFIGREIPVFVASREFLSTLKGLLAPHGRLFINFLQEKEYGKKADKLDKTLRTLFGTVDSTDYFNNRFFLVQ